MHILRKCLTQLIEKAHAFRGFYLFRSEDSLVFNRDQADILTAIRDNNPELVSHPTIRNVKRGFETLKAVYELRRKRGGAE